VALLVPGAFPTRGCSQQDNRQQDDEQVCVVLHGSILSLADQKGKKQTSK
jgi:hypothetical protein